MYILQTFVYLHNKQTQTQTQNKKDHESINQNNQRKHKSKFNRLRNYGGNFNRRYNLRNAT